MIQVCFMGRDDGHLGSRVNCMHFSIWLNAIADHYCQAYRPHSLAWSTAELRRESGNPPYFTTIGVPSHG